MKRRNQGFTLVEMLCTVVILLLVSATVTVGTRLAVENYTASITASESQTLCTTVLDAVGDILRYSTRVTDWSEELHFQSDRYDGVRYFAVEDGKVILAAEGTEIAPQKLLPVKAYPNGLQVRLLQGQAFKNGQLLDLTAAEYKLLCLFLHNPNTVLTKELILEKLWDRNEDYIDSSTLTVYIRRLRMKIEDDPSNPKMLLTVRGMGYKWNVLA